MKCTSAFSVLTYHTKMKPVVPRVAISSPSTSIAEIMEGLLPAYLAIEKTMDGINRKE
jgi:hypothetical protein